jgi:hypothetical protein
MKSDRDDRIDKIEYAPNISILYNLEDYKGYPFNINSYDSYIKKLDNYGYISSLYLHTNITFNDIGVNVISVSNNFLDTSILGYDTNFKTFYPMSIKLLSGRTFNDNSIPNEIIIDETTSKQLFDQYGLTLGSVISSNIGEFVIVGVVSEQVQIKEHYNDNDNSLPIHFTYIKTDYLKLEENNDYLSDFNLFVNYSNTTESKYLSSLKSIFSKDEYNELTIETRTTFIKNNISDSVYYFGFISLTISLFLFFVNNYFEIKNHFDKTIL